jgi:uncharacterized repeat protein (TIGR01451 family)
MNMHTPRILSRLTNRRFRMLLPLALALGFLMVVFVPFAAGDSDREVNATIYVSSTQASSGDKITFWIWIEPLKEKAKRLVVTEDDLEGLANVSSKAPSVCLETSQSWVCVLDDRSPFSIEVGATVANVTAATDIHFGAEVRVWDKEKKDNQDDEDHAIRVSTKVHILPRNDNNNPRKQPDVKVQLIAVQQSILPGGPLNYQVEVTNNGTAAARNVSVVVTIPSAFVLISASPWPSRQEDQLTWILEVVPRGTTELLFSATLPPSSRVEHVDLAIVATYGDGSGQPVHSQNIATSVEVLPMPPAPPMSLVPAAVALLVIGFVVRFVFLPPGPIDASLLTGSGADEIFLLHRSGVLLRHFSSSRARDIDSDILGGMLAAVRMFVEDSMDPAAGPLQEIRFGGGSIVFVTGANAALAAVNIQGNRVRFGQRAMEFLREFESANGDALVNFDGVCGPLKGVEAINQIAS